MFAIGKTKREETTEGLNISKDVESKDLNEQDTKRTREIVQEKPAGTSGNTNGFNLNANPSGGSAPAVSFGLGAKPETVAAPFGGAQQAAPVAVSKPAETEAPKRVEDSFLNRLTQAIHKGRLGQELIEELKQRYQAPFTAAVSKVNTQSGATAPSATVPQNTTSSTIGFGIHSTARPALTTTNQPAPALPFQHAQDRMKQEEAERSRKRECFQVAHELLYILSGIDSGRYNIDLTEEETIDQIRTMAEGLTGSLASVLPNTALDIIQYIQTETDPSKMKSENDVYRLLTLEENLQPQNPSLDLVRMSRTASTEMNSVHDTAIGVSAAMNGDSPGKKRSNNPILNAAQSLYLITRHFHMVPAFVNKILPLLKQLFGLIDIVLKNKYITYAAFAESSPTAPLASLVWLVVHSLVNSLSAWKKLYNTEGQLVRNSMLDSEAPRGISPFVKACQADFEKRLFSDVEKRQRNIGLQGNDGVSRFELPHPDSALYVIDAFLSILTFAEGCYWREQTVTHEGKGHEMILDSLLGDRIGKLAPHSYTTREGADQSARYSYSAKGLGLHRGRALKRMVDLVPLQRTLNMTQELVYILPNEIVSYLFDHMLILIKHLSEIEQAAFKTHIECIHLFSESAPGNQPGARISGSPLISSFQTDRDAVDGQHKIDVLTDESHHFISEIPHLLEVCAITLEHLPSDVLNPDLDMDCAITFFISNNCVQHIEQILNIQRSSSTMWENYSLKLMSRFLDVLSMIARNSLYLTRVVKLLEGVQTKVESLSWAKLVYQAQECAGISSRHNVASETVRAGLSQNGETLSTMENFYRSTGAMFAQTANNPQGGGTVAQYSKQFARWYTNRCRHTYIASLFILFRQMLSHAAVRPSLTKYLTLKMALAFLSSPESNPVMLGSTLSLISALIGDAADAALVWKHLEQRGFLRGKQIDFYSPTRARRADGASTEEVGSSLIGHCKYDLSRGECDIATGFLNLMIALFRLHEPDMDLFSTYSSVVNFVSGEIFCGIQKRAMRKEDGRHTVIALAAAALRYAFDVTFSDESTSISFSTIMSASNAPSDVVGEAVEVIRQAYDIEYEISHYHCAAVRQCIKLLTSASIVYKKRKELLHPFVVRVTNSQELVRNLLPFATKQHTLLAEAALQLLLQFPEDTVMAATCNYLLIQDDVAASLVNRFAEILDPSHCEGTFVDPAPSLLILDVEDRLTDYRISSLLPHFTRVKELLLDLLIAHTRPTQPTLPSWLLGCFASQSPTAPQFLTTPHHRVFLSLVKGASDEELESISPSLSVKYMQLLALLRQNKFYGLYHVRLWLDSENGALLFNMLLRYSPADERVSSILMKKYSYLLDLLSWELGYLHVRHPEQLDVHFEGVSPTAVTVFFALFVAAQEKRMRLTSARKTEGLTARADMLEWLQHIIVGLPVLTSLRAPKDTSAYLVDTDDGVSLYDIGAVERDFTQERAASAMQPLSVDEMRAKLLPFVSANDCLLHYHNAVHFIKSWSSLMSLGVLCVRGIKLGFLHYTVDYLCDMMKKRLLCLSLESREHIVSYLSSIVGDCCHQMKLLCQHGTEEELQLVRVPVPDSTSGRTRLSGSADSTAFPPWEYSSVRQSKLTKGSLVRPRVEEDQHVSHPYSRMSELTSLIASCIVAKNVGEQVPLCRIGLYTGMIALLSIPGVELDQFLMNTELNYRRRILQLIVTDISSIFELPTGGATPSTVKNPSSAMVRSIAERISPLAITLLIIVLESTPLFFSEDATLLFGCVRGLLQQIDSQILYQEKSESSLKLIAGTFDLISLLGARDPSGLFSNGILSTCIDLQCWSVTPQVIADNNVSSMASSGTMLQAAVQLSDVAPVRRLLTHLIVGVIDGFNRCFQNQGMGRKFKFVREAQRFIRRHTPFLKYLLEEPFLQSSINLGITVFQLVTVEKITHLLRCFSDTCIVEECRFLREDMQLVALLRSLSSDESMYETSYYDIGQSNAASPFSKTLKMQPSVANEAQRRAMAKTVLNLSHFLLRTECGLWDRSLMDLAGVPHSFAEENRHYNIVNSLLRETPENVQMLLLILNSVTCCIDRVSKNARLTGSLCFLELSYEVRALWRLALLFDMIIQSLPSDGNGQQNRLLGDSYRQYLATLPLGELQRALEYAKKVLHALSEFNTDYEGSLSLQNVPGGYAIRAGSVLAHAGNALKAGGNTSKDNSEPPSPLINDPLQRSRMLNPSPPQTPRTPPQGGSGFRQDTAAGGRGNQNQPKANAVMRAVLNDGSVNPNAPIRIGACEDSYVHHRVGEVTGRFDAPQPQLTVVRDTNNRANQSTLGNVVQESIFTKMLNNTIHISDSQNGIHSNLNTNEQTAVVGPVALDPFQTQLDQLLQGEEQVVAHAGLGKIPDAEHIIALSGYVRNTKIEVVNTLHTLKRITQTQ